MLAAQGGLKADINVTPLVDVMLVLLIIMMLSRRCCRRAWPSRCREAANTGDKPDTQDQTVVAIDSRDQFWVNALAVPDGRFADRVKRALEDKNEKSRPHQG